MESKIEAPSLSIVIPCFNEARTILELINRVQNSKIMSKEIIIVDDGSNDGTRELLQTVQSNNIKILYHSSNQGKGAALSTGFKAATGH